MGTHERQPHHHRPHVLRGGPRDGDRVELAHGVTELVAMSEAPGLLDVYDLTADEVPDPETGDPIGVLEFTGQRPTGDMIAAELQNMPSERSGPTA